MTEYKVTTPEASLRGVVTTSDGEIWATENFANKIAHMSASGKMIGEYDIPTNQSGARCITSTSKGRIFFTQYDAGSIGEVLR
jgi:virginiamycin B lyase